MPDADELIITRLIVEADEFIQGVTKSRDQIEQFKLELRELSVESGKSLKDIGAEWLKLAEQKKKALAAKIPGGEEGEFGFETQKEELAQYVEQIKNLRKAIGEAQKDESLYSKQQAKQIAENTALRKQQSQGIIKDSTASKAAQAEYVKITRQGYGVMSVAAQQYGQQVQKTAQVIQSTAQRTGQSWQQVGQRMTQLGIPIQQVNAALQQLDTQAKQATTGVGGLTSKISGLGGAAKYVFGTVLGLSAITALRSLIRFLTEVTERFIDFRRSIFVLEVSVRALQRAGFETTIESWTEVIDDFKRRFPIFSYQEIVSAVDVAILKLREYKFTQEEIIDVLETSALLARGFGKDFGEMSERITGAITRGWFEALQSMGIPLSRIEIMQEAYNQSLDKSFNLLDESTRAHLAYKLLMENTGMITEDLANITEESFDRVKIAEAELTDATMEFGQTWEDTFVAIKEAQAEAFRTLTDVGLWITRQESRFNRFIANMLIQLNLLIMAVDDAAGVLGFDRISDSQYKQLEQNIANLQASVEMETAKMEEDVNGLIESLRTMDNLDPTVDITINFAGAELSQEDYDNIVKIVQEANEEITEIEEEAAEKRIDINDDYLSDIEDIHEKALDKRLDLWRDYQRKLSDISTKASQKEEDEIRDYGYRVADAERDATFRRQEAERKYRENELKDERKFQEKLRQLRENFLFDLEDAVAERDARQIMRLTRQYNLRRDQMVREEKISGDDKQSAFEEELRQIEFQRQERLQQLAIEHERRIQEIALQASRERAQAAIDYERRKAEEATRVEEEKKERADRRQEQLDKLDEDTQDRVNKIIAGLMKEYSATRDWLNPISELYENTYGPNGRIDAALQWYQQRLMQTWLLQQKLKLMQGNASGSGWSGLPPDYDDAGGQAKGGTIIARKPTVALFGEAGPEMATFTPLNNLAETTPFGGQAPEGARDSKMGKLRLEMLLSPDLEARIVDDTLNEVADVIYTIERERR